MLSLVVYNGHYSYPATRAHQIQDSLRRSVRRWLTGTIDRQVGSGSISSFVKRREVSRERPSLIQTILSPRKPPFDRSPHAPQVFMMDQTAFADTCNAAILTRFGNFSHER